MSKPESDISTLREHGVPTVAQAALGIARSKIGQAETPGKPNEGPIVDWSLEGLTRVPASGRGKYKPGWAKWCAFFVIQCVRRALLDLGPGGSLLLLEWLRITRGAGDVDVLWARLEALGCTCLAGEAQPEPGCFVFWGKPGNLQHVGLVDRVSGVLLFTVEGNHGNCVAEDSYNLADPAVGIYGYARLPF